MGEVPLDCFQHLLRSDFTVYLVTFKTAVSSGRDSAAPRRAAPCRLAALRSPGSSRRIAVWCEVLLLLFVIVVDLQFAIGVADVARSEVGFDVLLASKICLKYSKKLLSVSLTLLYKF
ncbi:Protein of unknown function [Gryllus bimaculatus]|nr:Protein of unknown function [Gryllus bimaculatus]